MNTNTQYNRSPLTTDRYNTLIKHSDEFIVFQGTLYDAFEESNDEFIIMFRKKSNQYLLVNLTDHFLFDLSYTEESYSLDYYGADYKCMLNLLVSFRMRNSDNLMIITGHLVCLSGITAWLTLACIVFPLSSMIIPLLLMTLIGPINLLKIVTNSAKIFEDEFRRSSFKKIEELPKLGFFDKHKAPAYSDVSGSLIP